MDKSSGWTSMEPSIWTRVLEALRRDWLQTKHDLHVGGDELHLRISDTIEMATGKRPASAVTRARQARTR
jgi:hypothetical protein